MRLRPAYFFLNNPNWFAEIMYRFLNNKNSYHGAAYVPMPFFSILKAVASFIYLRF